jgi:hypothetical protein
MISRRDVHSRIGWKNEGFSVVGSYEERGFSMGVKSW